MIHAISFRSYMKLFKLSMRAVGDHCLMFIDGSCKNSNEAGGLEISMPLQQCFLKPRVLCGWNTKIRDPLMGINLDAVTVRAAKHP